MFYWPTVDLLLWGLTSRFVQSQSPDAPNIILVIISGILFWIIVWRGQYEITVNFLEELWNKNLVNLFISPLKIQEWILSVFIIGIIKMFLSLSFASFLAYFLYNTNILNYGFYLLPFGFLLILTGWAVGLFIVGIILRYGTRMQTLAWTAIMMISPFSAVYYPLSILPKWAQIVGKMVPSSYIFENGRSLIFKQTVNHQDLLISLLLNIVYLSLGLSFFWRSFIKAKQKGLISIY
jgi:ABC-2 type transport system permease protein